METQIDVFLSHNSKDTEIVEQIATNLRDHDINVWLDVWNIVPGESFQSPIEEALRQCRSAAVFISPNNMGKWQLPEIQVAIDQQVKRNIRVMAVLLPGIPDEMINQLPSFLTLNRWVDYRNGVENEKGLYDLRWGITGVKPPSKEPSLDVPPTPSLPQPSEVNNVLYNLVNPLKTQNITFFLGPGISYREHLKIIRACDIARELLVELKVIPTTYAELLPPIDVVGMYYAVNRGEQGLEDKVVEIMMDDSHAMTKTHEYLATLIELLTRRPKRRMLAQRPHVIVTTNIDVLMERALLRRGISFTRMVQHRSAQQITINEYRFVQLIEGKVIQLPSTSGSGAPVQVDVNDFDKLDELIESYGRRVEQEAEGITPLSKNATLNSLNMPEITDPILYKFLGSKDVSNSSLLSTLQHFEFARRAFQYNCIPEQLTEIIGNSNLLFVGLWFMDPDFRLTYSLLRKALEIRNFHRYALQLPPDNFKGDIYRQMEIGMWESIKDTGMLQLGIKTVEQPNELFLEKLINKIREEIQE